MKILHIARTPLTLKWFLIPTLREQRRRGHQVFITCAEDPGVEVLRAEGFEIIPNTLVRNFNPINLWRGMRELRRIIREGNYDLLITHNHVGAAAGRIAGWLENAKKVVYLCHGLACAPSQNWLVWSVAFTAEWTLGRITDGLLVVNAYDENLARKYLIPKRGRVARFPTTGIDLVKFAPSDSPDQRAALLKELNSTTADKVVVCIARAIKPKGVFEYVRAACQIAREFPSTLFLHAGDGPELAALRDIVSAAGLESNIRILGWRDDVHRILRASDIFVLPTYYPEGLPISILEAMACGKPVIASTQRGCVDAVVDGKTGFLVPIRDDRLMADRIRQLLRDDSLCREMGRAGRLRAEDEFEVNKCTQRIMELFDFAMGADEKAPAPVRS